MPVRRIEVEPTDYKEAVDVVASATMKEAHKPFGEYAKKIANVLRAYFRIPKGHWQAYWTVATRCFTLAYGGHGEDVVVALGRALGRELGIGDAVGEQIARAVYRNMDYILGKKAELETATEATRPARR